MTTFAASAAGPGLADHRLVRWSALAVSVLLVLTGCGAGAEEAGSATPRAEAYIAAWHVAWATGFTDVAQFLVPDATMDRRGYGGSQASGRAHAVQTLRADWAGYRLPVVVPDEPAYLSADGAVDPSRIDFGTAMVPEAPVYRISAEGIHAEQWTGSLLSGIEHVHLEREPVDRITQLYLGAWRDARGGDVDALYTEDAAITDSLLDLRVEGHDAIRSTLTAAPDQGGLPGATVRTIPEEGGPTVYLASTWNGYLRGPLQVVVLLLDVADENGCPGPVAVQLSLDDEDRVVAEDRYHRADAVDRCLDLEGRDVWWKTVVVPDPTAFTVTGALAEGPLEVPVWNGTQEREELLRWALGQFADGLLPPPEPRSVTFVPPDPDPWGNYGFLPGEPDVPLPSSAEGCPDTGCDPWPTDVRVESLTTLAHLWLANPALSSLREEYVRAVGADWTLPAADGARYPPLRPAAHRAAHTITWGLMDEPYPLPDDIAGLTCEQLAADFLALTLAEPVGTVCDTPGGAPS